MNDSGICGMSSADMKSYVVHTRLHRDEKKVLFMCKVEGCSKHFPKYAGFARHVKRNHYFVKYDVETNYKV